jgi:dienelactone hydrolase
MKKYLLFPTISLSLAALLMSGCSDTITEPQTTSKVGSYTIFDSVTSDIPYPNDILFAGSTDATLNISYDPTDKDAMVKHALDELDGFSTQSPITISITDAIDAATLPGAIHLYEAVGSFSNIAVAGGIPTIQSIQKELTFGVDYVATYSSGKLVILPLKPLIPHARYMVALTNNIKNSNGQRLEADALTAMLNGANPLADETGTALVFFDANEAINNAKAQSLEGLRQLTQLMRGAIATHHALETSSALNINDVVLSWSFTTQSIGNVAAALTSKAQTLSPTLALQNSGFTAKQMLQVATEDDNGTAQMYVGSLSTIPYYLGFATHPQDTAPRENYFEFNTTTADLPAKRADQTIPVLASMPNSALCGDKPATGWPVVIFQHGITQNRTNVLPIADAFSSICYASIAIDLPLHGIEDNTSTLYTPIERHFNLDLVNNDTSAPGPDGIIDPSINHYVNFTNLLATRDNLRQSTSDFVALEQAIKSSSDFDATQMAFVGHSLGTISAYGYLTQANLESATLAMTGGGIAQLFSNSKRYGVTLRTGLEAVGITPDSPEYEAFLLATQTVIDDADPVNYAAAIATKQKILALEVIGGENNYPSDFVIPNAVATAPLAGTQPILTLVNAQDINISAPGLYPTTSSTVVRYVSGEHGSLIDPRVGNDLKDIDIDPAISLAATTEMQTQVASFIQSKATGILISNTSLLKK